MSDGTPRGGDSAMNDGNRSRERAVAEVLVSLADSLVDDYDVIDMLHRLTEECVQILPVDAAGLLLSDQRGNLQLVSSSTEQARLLELFQLQAEQGPCMDCFRTSRQVTVPDLAREDSRWPRFVARASAAGYAAVHAMPLRLRDETIGALNLFNEHAGALESDSLRIGQALADIATISILQERAVHRNDVLVEQLHRALSSRIIIEQAKGVIAERNQVDMPQAFADLRGYARRHRRKLTEVATEVVEGKLAIPLEDASTRRVNRLTAGAAVSPPAVPVAPPACRSHRRWQPVAPPAGARRTAGWCRSHRRWSRSHRRWSPSHRRWTGPTGYCIASATSFALSRPRAGSAAPARTDCRPFNVSPRSASVADTGGSAGRRQCQSVTVW